MLSSSSSSSPSSFHRVLLIARNKLHLMTWSAPRCSASPPSSASSSSSSLSWWLLLWWWSIGWLLRASLVVVSVIIAFNAAAWYYRDEYYLRVSVSLLWPTERPNSCYCSLSPRDDAHTALDDVIFSGSPSDSLSSQEPPPPSSLPSPSASAPSSGLSLLPSSSSSYLSSLSLMPQKCQSSSRISYISSSMSEHDVQSLWDRKLNHSVASPFRQQWFRGYNMGLTHLHHHLISIGRVSSFNLCYRKPPHDGTHFYAYTFACRLPLTDSTDHFYSEHESDMSSPSTSPHSVAMSKSPTFSCPSLHYATQPFPPTPCQHKGSEDHRYFTFHDRVYGLGQYWSPSYSCDVQLPIIIEYDAHSLLPIQSQPIHYRNSQRLKDHDKNWVPLRPVDRELDREYLLELPGIPLQHSIDDSNEQDDPLKWYLWVMRSPLPLKVGLIDVRTGVYTQLDHLPPHHPPSASFQASAAVFDCYPYGISGGTNAIPWHFDKSGAASDTVTGLQLPEGMRYDYLLMVLHEKRVQWRWPARYYYHSLVVFDARPPFVARKVSLPFAFGSDDSSSIIVFDDGLSSEGSLQYAVGLAYANKPMSELLISYGEDDCHARFAQLHATDVERLLGIPQFRSMT